MPRDTVNLGDLFQRFGILDEQTLKACLDRQQELRARGEKATLGKVIVELGYADARKVQRVLANGGTAVLTCPGCGNKYTVGDYQMNRRYKCGDCTSYLEFSGEDVLDAEDGQEDSGVTEVPSEEAAVADPFIGRVFGKYKLVREIGRGGMGTVYAGERVDDGGPVAVKILGEQFTAIESIVKRFKREAFAGHRLQHENIVHVHAAGRVGKNLYIASELVDGPSLEDVIVQETRLPAGRAVAIMKDVLSGLQHAHDKSLAHRDIKPANILLTSSGRAKVIDFGLAKDEEAQTILTMAGNVMGTPSYMSPEQAMGERGGPESDLYACGVVMFVMLTGKRPFAGKTLLETLEKHIKAPIPPMVELNPEVSPALQAWVGRMMAKKAGERYPSPTAAVEALDAAMREPDKTEEVPASPAAGSEARSRWWIWGLVAGGLALAALATWLLTR